jgi:hypothetical protein
MAVRDMTDTMTVFANGLVPGLGLADITVAGGRIAALGTAGVTSSVFIPAGPDPLRALTALARVL